MDTCIYLQICIMCCVIISSNAVCARTSSRSAGRAGYSRQTCAQGRSVLVHLFCWKWTDVARECEQFLGPHGFCGVQVSPPNEHRVVELAGDRPWWERYQPVSYRLHSRGGNADEFEDMVRRCQAVDVRVYVDVVMNHMAAVDGGRGVGSGGSSYDTERLEFPGVPYGPADFNHCQGHGSPEAETCHTASCNIEDYGNRRQVRDCRLLSLADLALKKENVRRKIAEYLNSLLALGVAGFRVDACKHMWPGDLEAIYAKVTDLSTEWFLENTRPFIFNEVIDRGGDAAGAHEYTRLGRVTEFRYGEHVSKAFRRHFPTRQLLDGFPWMLPSNSALVFIDNHDNQRGHGGGGSVLTFWEEGLYRRAAAFMLAWPYGTPRLMSSYRWAGGQNGANDSAGPPHHGPPLYNVKNVTTLDDHTCADGWVCEHRWRPLANMVTWRRVTGDTSHVSHLWHNQGNQIAFSRGGKAFIVFNNEEYVDLDAVLDTGLPVGIYCDVISGSLVDGNCTGEAVSVDDTGRAFFFIAANQENPMMAFHIEARLPDCEARYQHPGSPPGPPPALYRLTAIFIRLNTRPGQNVYIRGGISHNIRYDCCADAAASPCAIPIRHVDGSAPGDTHLDWYGRESGQPPAARGSPAVWTTDRPNQTGYHPLNRYGAHFWLLHVTMDCARTEGGWFEVKAFVTSRQRGWEHYINQSERCGGSAGGLAPFPSHNHVGRCGHINVFHADTGYCHIDSFSDMLAKSCSAHISYLLEVAPALVIIGIILHIYT